MFNLLEKFSKVVETGNLTKASKELYITQPALSISIKQLEKKLGCKLLIRRKDGVTPTKLGKIVYKFTKKISKDLRNIKVKLEEKNKALSTSIKIGMIDNVGLVFISKTYKQFQNENPNINLQIRIDNTTRLIGEVEKGTIDFAIVSKCLERFPQKFIVKDFAEEEMTLVGKPPFIEEIKKAKDLEKINFITYNKDSTTFHIIDNVFREKNIKINYVAYSSSPEFILEMVRQGTGIAALPANIVENEIRLDNLEKITIKDLKIKRRLSLIYLKDTYLPKITKQFIEKLQNEFSI